LALKLWLRALAPVIPMAGFRWGFVPTDMDLRKSRLPLVPPSLASSGGAFLPRSAERTLAWTSPAAHGLAGVSAAPADETEGALEITVSLETELM
jgi:hypothetical protein